MGRIRDSSTFAARQRSEIGRYEVPTEVSFLGFGILRIHVTSPILGEHIFSAINTTPTT